MLKVCIIEDSGCFSNQHLSFIPKQGFSYHIATDPGSYLQANNPPRTDIIIINHSQIQNGISIAQKIRTHSNLKDVILIIITKEQPKLENKLKSWALADYCFFHPLEAQELSAVLKTISRRFLRKSNQNWSLFIEDCELYIPFKDGIKLTYRETIIFKELAIASPAIVSSKHLIESLDEDWLHFEKNRLELLISRLRHKIKNTGWQHQIIRSIRNKGYCLTVNIDIHQNKTAIK